MYQIYALKYAERDTPACGFFYREHSHETITLHYFVWLILGGPHPVLLDTGFQEDDVERRGIRNDVRYQPTQIITNLPEMLAGFDTINALAGDPARVVTGHDPEVAARFKPLEPGIIQIA